MFQRLASVVSRSGYTYCHTYEDGDRRLVVHTLDSSEISHIERMAEKLGFELVSDRSDNTYIFSA